MTRMTWLVVRMQRHCLTILTLGTESSMNWWRYHTSFDIVSSTLSNRLRRLILHSCEPVDSVLSSVVFTALTGAGRRKKWDAMGVPSPRRGQWRGILGGGFCSRGSLEVWRTPWQAPWQGSGVEPSRTLPVILVPSVICSKYRGLHSYHHHHHQNMGQNLLLNSVPVLKLWWNVPSQMNRLRHHWLHYVLLSTCSSHLYCSSHLLNVPRGSPKDVEWVLNKAE